MLPPERRMVVCATFLDRIFEVRKVVEALAAWPRLGALILTAHAWADDSRDVPPGEAADWARAVRPSLDVRVLEPVGDAARAALSAGDLVLLLGNGMAYGLEGLA